MITLNHVARILLGYRVVTGRFRNSVPIHEQGTEDDIQPPLLSSFSNARKTEARCGNMSWPQNTEAL